MSERTIRGHLRERAPFDLPQEVPETRVVAGLLAFHALTFLCVLVPVLSDALVVRAALVMLNLTFVPGLLVLVAFGEFRLRVSNFLYAMGLSLVAIMTTGVVSNLVLPWLGFERPLSVPWLTVTMTVLVGGIGVVAHRRASREGKSVDLTVLSGYRITPSVAFLALLLPITVLVMVLGLQALDRSEPVVALLVIVATIPIGVALARRFERHRLAVWVLSFVLLHHATLSSGAGGGSSVPMHIMEVQQWTPGFEEIATTSTSLLPNGILYPTYATLIDIPYFVQTGTLNPFLVSLLPVVLFEAYRRYVSDTGALLGVCVFVFAHPFYNLYPGGGRVATPVIFLALLALLIADDDLGPIEVRLFSLTFAMGLVVSHYGTSYFAMIAFVGAFAVLGALWMLERGVDWEGAGITGAFGDRVQLTSPHPSAVVTGAFVGFFVVLVLAWYLYTSGGDHFSLPRHVARSLGSLFGGDFFTGSTANRVTKSYGVGTQSIRYSRLMYVGLIGLMGVGLLVESLRRLRESASTRFDDEFLVVGGFFLATAGSSFVLPVGWGGGRPMMIAFTFSAVFAVVGIVALAKAGARGAERALDRRPWWARSPTRAGYATFAAILAVFLLLNTGVGAATVVGGTAPSNVPLEAGLEASENPDFNRKAHIEEDVATLAWVQDYRANGVGMRGDLITNGMTDKYRSSIAMAMEEDVVFPYDDTKPQGYLNQIGESSWDEYVFVMGHNNDLGVYTLNSSYERQSMDPIWEELEDRSIIYTTGTSDIYYGGNESARSVDD